MTGESEHRRSLSQFIQEGGIPATDHFYLYSPGAFKGMVHCVGNETYLNRNLACGPIARIRRKLFFEYGLGRLPVVLPPAQKKEPLFWGRLTGDIRLQSVTALFGALSRRSADAEDTVVVVGATDDSFGSEYARRIPEGVQQVFALNCETQHPKLHWYPYGRDYKGEGSFNILPKPERKNLVYCNFSPATHPDRKRTLELLVGKEFVHTVNFSGYGEYTGYPMSNREFLEQLSDHTFSVCPRGTGFDTYRIWDSLHLGVIPIVVKEAEFHTNLEKLPVLLLDSVEQFGDLTEPFLQRTYREMMDQEYDFSPLSAAWWHRRFRGVDGTGTPTQRALRPEGSTV